MLIIYNKFKKFNDFQNLTQCSLTVILPRKTLDHNIVALSSCLENMLYDSGSYLLKLVDSLSMYMLQNWFEPSL